MKRLSKVLLQGALLFSLLLHAPLCAAAGIEAMDTDDDEAWGDLELRLRWMQEHSTSALDQRYEREKRT